MAIATFQFSFRNCDSFVFQDANTSSKTDKTLAITFPDGNVLTFEEFIIDTTTKNDAVETGYLGYDGHEILADLDEWGFDDVNGKIVCNIESLTEDIASNPEMFKDSEGNNTSFYYTYFPSGVYYAVYTFKIGTTNYSYNKHIQYTNTANQYLKEKAEWLLTHDTEINTTKYQYDLVKDVLMQMVLLIQIASFDFTNHDYIECNLKLTACDRLYNTGLMSYKYDEGRL